MVMATGIVATGVRLDGWRGAFDVLVVIAAAVWLATAAGTLVLVARSATALSLDAREPGAGFAWYAVVAACVVLGGCLAALGGPGIGAATVLAVLAATAWLAVTALVPARFGRRSARPALRTVVGTWYLWPVATQALAIAAAQLAANGVLPTEPGVITAITAWSVGVMLYLVTSALVAARLRRAGPGPAGTRAAYWVVMGAAAISVLAAALILRIPRASTVLAAGPALKAVGLVLWSAGTVLYLVLAALTARWWTRTRRRPGYQPSTWVIVFPLGMYAVASWQLGSATGVAVVHDIGTVAVWPAAAAWTGTAVALASSVVAAVRGVAARLRSSLRPDHPQAGKRSYKFEALVTIPSGDDSPAAALPGPDWHGVIRATAGSPVSSPALFSAVVAGWDLHNGGEAGSTRAVATIVAFGAEPAHCLPVGGTFALWRGHDVGHGIVTRRIFV